MFICRNAEGIHDYMVRESLGTTVIDESFRYSLA